MQTQLGQFGRGGARAVWGFPSPGGRLSFPSGCFFILAFSTLELFQSLPMLARRNRVVYAARRRL